MTQPATQPNGALNQTPEERRQTQIAHNRALIALLDSWEQEDAQEQRETFAMLARALDEDRPSFRKLFADS